jgi:NAD(P)-dependent dehydrogenase (short-subunit alcohol dehydrogenase family)
VQPRLSEENMTDIDLFGLKGAHVVVTGASGGIGLATIKLFYQLGANISAHGNSNTEAIKSSVENSAGRLNAFKADATDEKEVEAFYEEACLYLGPPDILVGNHQPSHVSK